MGGLGIYLGAGTVRSFKRHDFQVEEGTTDNGGTTIFTRHLQAWN